MLSVICSSQNEADVIPAAASESEVISSHDMFLRLWVRLERPRHDTSDLFIDLTDVLQNGSAPPLQRTPELLRICDGFSRGSTLGFGVLACSVRQAACSYTTPPREVSTAMYRPPSQTLSMARMTRAHQQVDQEHTALLAPTRKSMMLPLYAKLLHKMRAGNRLGRQMWIMISAGALLSDGIGLAMPPIMQHYGHFAGRCCVQPELFEVTVLVTAMSANLNIWLCMSACLARLGQLHRANRC